MLLYELKKRLIDYLESKQNEKAHEAITVEEPRNRKFGDLSTNAAMVMAPILKKSPADIAGMIEEEEISQWEEVGTAMLTASTFSKRS
jgi:arginyl-tRNA synthetase